MTTVQRLRLLHLPRRRRGIRYAVASEAGFALPTVMMAMIAAFALGSAVVVSSIGAQQGTVRDQNSKQALATAEAGVAHAMALFNSTRTAPSESPCKPLGDTAAVAGWCPTGVGPIAFDRGTFSYRVGVSQAVGTTAVTLKIVSTGAVAGVSRRVSVLADSAVVRPFSGEASVLGLDGIFLSSFARITGGVATNGNIELAANAALNCNYAQVGEGKGIIPANQATCTQTEGVLSLPPVNPGDVATVNSNARICAQPPAVGDPCNKATWDPATKRLSFDQPKGSILLGAAGGVFNYALCQLTLRSNSYLRIAGGAVVRIYLLGPEQCNGETAPMLLESNSKIESTGSGDPNLSLLIVGSDEITTTAEMSSNTSFACSQSFVLYAPRTELVMRSNNTICGGVAAKSISLSPNTIVSSHNAASEWELPTESAHYSSPHGFIECTAVQPTATAPDGGC